MGEKKTFKVHANGMDFYCEQRGTKGPKVVIIPQGDNDCEEYDSFAIRLENEFQTLTFDPRGGSRSMDPEPKKVTAKMLADDTAAIMEATGFVGATVWGCSSGGQAALATGKYHPEVAKKIIVHEAALQSDTPIPGTGLEFFQRIESFQPYYSLKTPVSFVSFFVDYDLINRIPADALARVEQNRVFWMKYYVGSVDNETYSKEDLAKMPPIAVSIGTWTPSWLTQANIATAERAGVGYTWFSCGHYPEVICPDEYVAWLRKEIAK